MEKRLFQAEEKSELLNENYQAAVEASRLLQSNGFEAYAIGGCVRDLLLGLQPKDYDLATSAAPDQILNLFERSTYPDTSEAFAVCRVIVENRELEIATFRRDVDAKMGRHQTKIELARSLEDDVYRRDFTINGLALDLVSNYLVDYVNGLEDLENGVLRFIGEPKERIEEDPLRLLRAVRFKNRFSFEYHPAAQTAIKEAVKEGRLGLISAERIRQELTALLVDKNRAKAVEDMDTLGILELLLPEVAAGKGVNQPKEYHSEGDVWTHQLMVLEELGDSPSDLLVWAALLHDIGKKDTQKIPDDPNGRITFYGHEQRSVELARLILNRLKFSNKEKEAILWLIGNHMRIRELPKMKDSKQLALLNHPHFSDLMALLRADTLASWKIDENGNRVYEDPDLEAVEAVYQAHLAKPLEERKKDLKADLHIDGHMLIERFGLKGAEIGRVKRALEEAYQNGEVHSQEEALKLAQQIIAQS